MKDDFFKNLRPTNIEICTSPVTLEPMAIVHCKFEVDLEMLRKVADTNEGLTPLFAQNLRIALDKMELHELKSRIKYNTVYIEDLVCRIHDFGHKIQQPSVPQMNEDMNADELKVVDRKIKRIVQELYEHYYPLYMRKISED